MGYKNSYALWRIMLTVKKQHVWKMSLSEQRIVGQVEIKEKIE